MSPAILNNSHQRELVTNKYFYTDSISELKYSSDTVYIVYVNLNGQYEHIF